MFINISFLFCNPINIKLTIEQFYKHIIWWIYRVWGFAIHYAAELLNPKSQGSELDEIQILSAIECILNISKNKLNIKEQEIIDEIADYRCRSGKLFGNNFIWKSSFNNPVSWWKGLCSSSSLSQVASRMLMMPASSAATERSFSVYSYIVKDGIIRYIK